MATATLEKSKRTTTPKLHVKDNVLGKTFYVTAHPGKVIKAYRKGLGLTLCELAKHSGVSASTISGLERGQRKASWGSFKRVLWIFNTLGIQLMGLPE